MNLQAMLERDEGRRNIAYADTLGKLTIGIGHTGPEVCKGLVWADSLIDSTFAADVSKATRGVQDVAPWFGKLNEARQAVLIAMAFQMGGAGLARFVGTLHAAERGDFDGAATNMLNSLWAHQTPARAARMAEQMRRGVWV